MKKSMIIFAVLVICAGTSFPQSFKPYPIPSFAVQVDSLAIFVESGGNTTDQSKARKDGYQQRMLLYLYLISKVL